MDPLAETARSTLVRRPQRGRRDRETVNAILDEALVCHVGFVDGSQPVVTPTSHWRVGDWLYFHGAPRSRLMLHLASGAPVCVSVALVDGLVLARSAFRHSVDYRSVMLFGSGEAVETAEEKRAAFAVLIDKMSPGRSALVRPPDDGEVAATAVARLAIAEGSAKVRSEPPSEADKDRSWTPWTGTIPVAVRAGAPIPAAPGAGAPPPLWPWLGGGSGI